MAESESRSLHLHTLESLVADLISGRSVQTAASESFALPDDRSRSALEWYRTRGPSAWTSAVNAQHAENLVDAIQAQPPQLAALPQRPANTNGRRLRLKKLEAHRFAGLHKFGTPDAAPNNYVHEFTSSLTLYEGRNGSGKTSLLNAIIWTLTGEILRPQREPEAAEDFECVVISKEGNDDTTHKLSPLSQPQDLRSAARLSALRKVPLDQLDATEEKLHKIVAEARLLDNLAENPSVAARMRKNPQETSRTVAVSSLKPSWETCLMTPLIPHGLWRIPIQL